MHDIPWLLCYDIRDPKRLRRVHRLAANLGFSINYSIFYMELKPKIFDALVQQLRKVIDPDFDDVRLYPCCRLSQMMIYGCPISAGIYLFQQGVACISLSTEDYLDGMDTESDEKYKIFAEPLGQKLVQGLRLG